MSSEDSLDMDLSIIEDSYLSSQLDQCLYWNGFNFLL